jgi:tRNA nucleotidyltransferase (CCA-adding enzyme)
VETYLVGGAVRDMLLGLEPRDRDYVVVRSTPEEMLSLGFKQVGADFPVFLHPDTGEEYALARTERKSGHGYGGFVVHADPDVTLEQDLRRRDFRINAMAMTTEGAVIDPFGGQMDLRDKVLRAVDPKAFVEDPVRVLRLARFAARYQDFSVDPDTMQLAKDVVASGEMDHLVSERIWAELAKGLMDGKPSRMFEVLSECGALKVLIPELDVLWGIPAGPIEHHPEVDCGVHVMMVIDVAAKYQLNLEQRFAALMHDIGKGLVSPEIWPHQHGHEALGEAPLLALCERLRVPSSARDLAVMTCLHHTRVHQIFGSTASGINRLFKRTDAYRRVGRFSDFLEVCMCVAQGRLGQDSKPYPEKHFAEALLSAALRVDAGAIAKAATNKSSIPLQIESARVHAIQQFLNVLNKEQI